MLLNLTFHATFSATLGNTTPTGSEWQCENYLLQPVLDTSHDPPLYVGNFSVRNGGRAMFSDSGIDIIEIFINLANQNQSLALNPKLKLTVIDAGMHLIPYW